MILENVKEAINKGKSYKHVRLATHIDKVI